MKQFGWLMILLSAGCCFGWVWQLQIARERAAHFQPVDAIVIANRIHKAWANDTIVQYRAEYQLQYTYDGQTYRRWESDPLTTTQRFRAEAILGQLSPGSHVEVYVDPSDPRRMTMQITGWHAYLAAILFGVLALLFGIAGILWQVKRREPTVVYLS
jgi:hypothetical protein